MLEVNLVERLIHVEFVMIRSSRGEVLCCILHSLGVECSHTIVELVYLGTGDVTSLKQFVESTPGC